MLCMRIRMLYKLIVCDDAHCRWAMKFQNLEPNDVLLSSKDRPKLPLIFYVKECLSPALSAAKPISFERVFLILTSVPVTHCETHNFFHNTQKMNCFLPSIWGFAQAFFFLVAAESFFRVNSWLSWDKSWDWVFVY